MTKWSNKELGYLAGLIDGEGYLEARANNYKGKTKGFSAGIVIGMHSKCVIDWLKEHFGGCVYALKRQKGYQGDHWKWELHRTDIMLALLPELIPLLVLKKEQAKVLLELYKHKATYSYSRSDAGEYRHKAFAIIEQFKEATKHRRNNDKYVEFHV